MKKKILTIFLTICLLFSLTPTMSFAATGDDSEGTTNTDTDGLVLTKSVTQTPDENDEYTITLDTYVTGTVTTSTISVPNDIIIVMDTSGSMEYDMEGNNASYNEETRLDALQSAVNNFITTVAKDAEDNSVDHTIALVEFSSSSSGNWGQSTSSSWAQTLGDGYYDVSNSDNVTTLQGYVNDLEADGGTGTDSGMEEALDLLKDNITDAEDRNQVVILFTDGQPGMSGFDLDYADDAIDAASQMKDLGATVYSVGIFTDANAMYTSGSSATSTLNGNTTVGSTWNADDDDGIYINNRFLNFISSNSSDATSLGIEEYVSGNFMFWTTYYRITDAFAYTNEGYYLTASTSEELDNIFQSIASTTIASSRELGTETRVQDYVSDYFQLPEGFGVDDVAIQIVACTGTDAQGEYTWDTTNKTYYTDGSSYSYYDYTDSSNKTGTLSVIYDEVKQGVIVEGFDYELNFVTDSDKNAALVNGNDADYGYKLVVSFNIKRVDGFIGGNDVETNTSLSGIYVPLANSEGDFITDGAGELVYNSISLGSYDTPDTQVDLEYDLTTQDQTIYLGNRISLYKILQINGHDVLGISNEFVDITFYIYEDGYLASLGGQDPDTSKAIADFVIPAGLSAEDAALLDINQPLEQVLPADSTSYDVYTLVTAKDPADGSEGVEDLSKSSLDTSVYVLQPQVEGADIWVDFGAQTNLRSDSTSPITWSSLDDASSEQGNLYDANADYAPTVYYIYHNLVTNECFKTQYQVDWNNDGDYEDTVIDSEGNVIPELGPKVGEKVSVTTWDGIDLTYTIVGSLDINIESEEQYEIIGIQALSSDGYYNISYYSNESEVYKALEADESITEDNTFNIFINKYDVSITKTVTTTQEEWETYPQSFIFEVSQRAYDYNVDLGVAEDATGDYTTDTEDNEYGITYRNPDVIEIVMDPDDFKLTSTNEDGTVNYTYTTTVTGLRAGLDAVITENTDWSWRYDLTETVVNKTLSQGTVIDTEIVLVDPIVLDENTMLSASSTLATGSILATGTTISDITLPEGSQIAIDVILDDTTTGHIFSLPVTLSANTTIKGDSYSAQIGEILAAGTTFAGDVTVEGKDYTDGDVLTEGVTLTTAVTLVEGTILAKGSKILHANYLPKGTMIPAGTSLASSVEITEETVLDVGVIISKDTEFTSGTTLASGTILTKGTVLPGDIDITLYETIDVSIDEDGVITVNYSHDLYTTGYDHDAMGLDTNKNGFNDTIVDITGDGIPDVQAFVYRDRNNDGYVDIDYLAPYATETEVKDKDYTDFDIPFDLDNDTYIDMLVSADAPGEDGRRLINGSMTAYTTDYFVGFYINEDGNIEASDGTLIFNRTNKYFNGYYVHYTDDVNDDDYGLIVGGNGGIYLTETEGQDIEIDYSGTATDFKVTNADNIGEDGDGSGYDHAGVTNVLIEDSGGNTYYGTGLVIIAEPMNLDLFNRDGEDETALEELPLLIRNTYRYINSNECLVFTGEYDHDGDGEGDAPETGQISTNFVNELYNDKWLSFDDVIANKYATLPAIGGMDND